MAKIAVAVEQAVERRAKAGTPGCTTGRPLASGDGWTVDDVICTSGPEDRPFEEQHPDFSIAIVVAGSFQYRAETGRELMMPGSLLLGHAGQAFECAHQHAAGDRCISFRYTPAYFERLVPDAAGPATRLPWRQLRVPPLPDLSPIVARACAALSCAGDAGWEDLSVELAGLTAQLLARANASDTAPSPAGAEARVTRIVRTVERAGEERLSLSRLAREAGLGPYHFLRTFERVTGVTPHQFILRGRLREAAVRLVEEPSQVLEIAMDCGFGDVSNFNRAFRREFGVSPRAYRGLQGVSSSRPRSADRTPR